MDVNYLVWIRECIDICMHIEDIDEHSLKKRLEILENNYLNLNDIEKNKINEFLNNEISEDDCIYIASIIITCTSFDELKEIMINNILNMEYDWIEGCMIETQIVARGNISNYVLLNKIHQKNVKLMSERFELHLNYIPVIERDKNKIVIITSSLLAEYHAPTKVLIRFVHVLQEIMRYDVEVFVCPLNRKMSHEWYNPVYMQNLEKWETKRLKINYEDTIIKGYQISMGTNVEKEYQMMLELIQAWKPIFVFQLGNINPIGDLTCEITTNVAKSMSIHLPVSNAEYLLSLKSNKDEEKFISRKQEIIYQKKIPEYFECDKNAYTRNEFGFKENWFLIAIVGNRLDIEIDEKFIEILKKMQKTDSNIIYVIIGECEILKEKINKKETIQAVFLGKRGDLMKIYPMMDLYLNPKRAGGGHSSLMALAAEVPVITLPDCDVAYNVGNEFVVSDYNELVDMVHCYVNNSDAYREKKEAAKEFAKKNSKEKMYKNTAKELEKIIFAIEKGKDN